MRKRPNRTPVGTRNKLTAEPRKGFKRRFVNDVEGRVEMFQEAGYEIVRNSARQSTEVGDPDVSASQIGATVRRPVGGGTHAVLMEISEEWYTEDQQAKEAALKEKEKSLLADATGDGFYGEGIKTSRRPLVQTE